MNDGTFSPDKSEGQERKYDSFKDLRPIEHLLIGSTFDLPNGGVFSIKKVEEDGKLRKDADFLLKPLGLTTKTSKIEEILKTRKAKGTLRGWFACFTASADVLRGGYGFSYLLDSLDNEFRFQITKNTTDGWLAKNEEDVDALGKIALPERFMSLFNLTKDIDNGVLIVRYKPLLDNIKPL